MKPKQCLPKRYLSVGPNPTDKAIQMFFIYLKHVPESWNPKKLYYPAVEKVREYWGINYGFGAMIKWGLDFRCSKSKSSQQRCEAMTKAKEEALGWIGKGIVLTYVKLAA